MIREMNIFNDAFFHSVRSILADPDFRKGYSLRSELGLSHLGNAELGVRRLERLWMLEVEIVEGWKELLG
jgi:hypothetical protein